MRHVPVSVTIRRLLAGAGSGLVLVMLAPGVAHAQDAALPQAAAQSNQTPGTPEDTSGLKDVVVTAEKKSTSVQRTPIAMAVVDSKTMEQNNIADLADLIKILPAVSYGRNFANTIVSLRGVSSRDTDETGDPAVAISIDGNYFNRTLGLNSAVFDLDRVEVLKGPQGTLYGRSATGGAINFITAEPVKKFSAYVSGGYGSYSELNSEGMLNVPINDWIQVRAAFSTRYHDGFFHNAPSKDGNDEDTKAARISLAIQPTSRVSGVITFEKVKEGGVGSIDYGTPLLYDASGAIIHAKPVLPSGNSWPVGLPSQYTDISTNFVHGHLNYELGGNFNLQFTGGYRFLDFNSLVNLDGQVGHASLYGTNAYFGPQHEKIRTTNGEVIFGSQGNKLFDFQAGLYYFREGDDLTSNFSYFDQNAPNGAYPRTGFLFRYPDLGTESKDAFGQISLHLTPKLTLEGGARYNHDKKWRFGYADYRALDFTLPVHEMVTEEKVTWHGALDYQATPTNLIYLKADSGYKPGGYTDAAPYGPETIYAYEVGSKNRFLNNKLQLNVDAYYYNYKDQQVLQFIVNRSYIRNAGKSEYYGIEGDANYILTSKDRFNVDVLYNHAEYKQFAIAVDGANLDLAGNTPPQAPRFSGNIGFEHDFDIFRGTLTGRAQAHFETNSHLQFYNYPDDLNPGYTRTDLIATYSPYNKKWSVEAYLRNVENRRVITAAQEQALLTSYIYQFGDPRTYGVKFRMNF